MPSQVTNYKCPSCTGPLHYDSKSGQMACEYCGSVFTVQQIEALYEGKNEQAENAFNAAQAAQAATAENAADHRRDELPLLRQPHDRARPVLRHADAGSDRALPA